MNKTNPDLRLRYLRCLGAEAASNPRPSYQFHSPSRTSAGCPPRLASRTRGEEPKERGFSGYKPLNLSSKRPSHPCDRSRLLQHRVSGLRLLRSFCSLGSKTGSSPRPSYQSHLPSRTSARRSPLLASRTRGEEHKERGFSGCMTPNLPSKHPFHSCDLYCPLPPSDSFIAPVPKSIMAPFATFGALSNHLHPHSPSPLASNPL